MRIVLFCENKYAVGILSPIQEEAWKQGGHTVLWYVHKAKIPDFPLGDSVIWTHSIQEVYDFSPQAIFVPGNIVPYYLPGVKIQVFHGYAAEKKDHWVIRRYFDTYFTQGPYFTRVFKRLAAKYGDFEVVETGWPKQDWIAAHRHDFDAEKRELLSAHHKEKLVLYAPTFSPSMTSLPHIKEALVKLVDENDCLLAVKLHPLTRAEWVEEYRELARIHPHILFMEEANLTKPTLMADVMVSDTSSAVYEFLLLDKPVITLRTIASELYWKNITAPEELDAAYKAIFSDAESAGLRSWVMSNYDPYTDGHVAERMLSAAQDYINRHGTPRRRRLNLWRKYQSIKRFGRIKTTKS